MFESSQCSNHKAFTPSPGEMDSKSGRHVELFDLPEELRIEILSYLTYNEITELRLVCQIFNRTCQQILTQAFSKVDKLHANIQKHVKSQLPRRESERRNHSLARHVDILSAIETRISLLGMTYLKYIDSGLCCFIPGKVLDEMFEKLLVLKKPWQPPRAHEFLQELRDISSMAMEHFEEKIVPDLKKNMTVAMPFFYGHPSPDQEAGHSPSTSTARGSVHGPSLRQEVMRLQNQFQAQITIVQKFRREHNESKLKLNEQRKQIAEQDKKIVEQNGRLAEQERKNTELWKKMLEIEQKFLDMNQDRITLDKPSTISDNIKKTEKTFENKSVKKRNVMKCKLERVSLAEARKMDAPLKRKYDKISKDEKNKRQKL